ncbi:expressed unknown protein [Seminavis robusta]|uniref:Uncharacterized protein n=1 Tax=Seminavis robusta TaxID=568900 RepID=A0A9N8E5W7_9STRA|nr:expressed unknown protein [Seminavis robusta]|eukprot:Sro582_g170550.1 n/a (384) ;mRNA; r:42026-43177
MGRQERFNDLQARGVSPALIEEMEMARGETTQVGVSMGLYCSGGDVEIYLDHEWSSAYPIPTFELLEKVLVELFQKRYRKSLCLTFSALFHRAFPGDAFDMPEFCRVLKRGTDKLDDVHICYIGGRILDDDLTMLLDNMQHNNMTIGYFGLGFCGDLEYPKFFRRLQELDVDYLELWRQCDEGERTETGMEMTEAFFAQLGEFIRGSCHLEDLILAEFCCQEAHHWAPVVAAIQDHPSLTFLLIPFPTTTSPPDAPNDKGCKFAPAVEDKILNRLAINRAKKALLLDDQQSRPSLEQFVDTLVENRFNVGCLDHILRNVDPHVYSPAAIQAAQSHADKKPQQNKAHVSKEEWELEKRLDQEIRSKTFRYMSEGDTEEYLIIDV